MPIESYWLLPEKILHVAIIGDISIDEVARASHDAITIFNRSSTAPIHIIVDDSRGGDPPKSIRKLIDAIMVVRHAKMGWMVVYGGENQLAKYILQILAGVTNLRYRRCQTLREAVAFLITVDDSLPDINHLLPLAEYK